VRGGGDIVLRLSAWHKVERVPGCFGYRVTGFGFRVALFFTRTYNRLLSPGLAATELRVITTPLESAFDKLAAQIDTLISHVQLSPQDLTRLHQRSFLKQG